MDNRSKVIGVAVVVAVIVSIVVVTLLIRNKNVYSACQLAEVAPTAAKQNEILVAADNSSLVRFNGFVELPGESEKDKPIYVTLAPKSTKFSNNVLEIKADCGKLTMTIKEDEKNKYVEKIELESAGRDGKTKTCSLKPSSGTNFFPAAKGKHYTCPTESNYSCDGDKQVPILHIFAIEFEVNRAKDAKPEFVTQQGEFKLSISTSERVSQNLDSIQQKLC